MIEPVGADRTRGLGNRRWQAALAVAAAVAIAAMLGTGAAVAAPPTLNGHVQYETFGYPDPQNGPRWENFFAATLRGSGQLSSTLTWQFEGRAVADDVDFTAGAYSPRNESRRRPYLSLITGVLDYRPSPDLRLSVGKQIANWSIFDGLQPANLITPHDESDAFRRVELGVPSVSVHYGSGGAFAELVVVPLAFTPSRLPQGRWAIANTIAKPPSTLASFVEDQDLPPVRVDETQAGARVGTRLGALEASLLGYVGRDTEAIFVSQFISLGIIKHRFHYAEHLVARYPRLRAGGFTASYPLADRWMLRVESVYYNSPDRDRDDFLHSVAGVEYALDDWRFVVNYLHDDQTVNAAQPVESPEPVLNKGERRFFPSFIFGEVRYDAGGQLRGQLRGGYDVTGEFLLVQPEVSYRLWRALRVALLGEVIQSNRSAYEHNKVSYFNAIRHEDRLGTRIEYDF